jgi:methionine-R-sulfoxide reductase
MAVTALAITSIVIGAGAQETRRPDSWREAAELAARFTSGVSHDGEQVLVQRASYSTDARRILEEGAAVDWPVQMSADEWNERLSDQEFYVLREDGTEQPFNNPLFDEKRAGIYYSRATGQPLFSSADKYESGTGWPSFTKPISPDAVAYMWDNSLFSRRIEVIDSLSGSHIGHVFSDGPDPTGQRYCMNSAALIFVPEGEAPPPLLIPENR